ncbi:MAG: hypothetical protein HN337_07665 [Deltaproteobacteria bacterium]|jgi:enoyl-CoA hydratase|nr:hypothetical protein [Deltaproteobacteria bacterium]
MEFKNILTETKAQVGIIKINRPKVLNALNLETVGELEFAIKKMDDDVNTRVLVITGEGDKAFVAGADIAAMKEMNESHASEFAEQGHRCMNSIGYATKPVIAAVNGFALGGGTELAISCDMILASESAKFGLPEVKLGLFPGFGGTQRLPRLIGASRAREMIFTGGIIDAKLAYEWGLASKLFPAASFMNDVMAIAEKIAENGPVAISMAKRVANDGLGMHFADGLKNEEEHFPKLFASKDRIEGLSAFLEKRKPNFEGK